MTTYTSRPTKCPECGARLNKYRLASTCTDCGLVLRRETVATEQRWRAI